MSAHLPRNLLFFSYHASPLRLLYGHQHPRTAQFNYSSIPSFSLSSRRQSEEERSRNVKVSVWWDFENCHIPSGVNVCLVVSRIVSALRRSGIKGPVTVTGFGDVSQLARSTQEALTATGVTLNHVPNCGKNSSDKSFMADLAYWVFQNPPPVHFFLISSDSDFAYILHCLRMSNYNILLASTDTAQGILCGSATIMWNWPCLVKGEENLLVKHFNYPPDGVNGSWYGHYRGSLDDPYAEVSQVENFQMVDSEELISLTNNHAIPNAVIDAISKILRSCPEGMYLSILRSRLERDNISLGKNFFGHKRFLQFLASLPDLVKIKNPQNGKNEPMVCLAEKALAKSLDLSSKPVQWIEDKEKGNVPSNNSQSTPVFPRSPNGYLDFSPQFDASKDSSSNNSVPSVENKSFDRQELVCLKNNYMDANFSITTLIRDDKSAVKEGLLRRILRILIGPGSKVSNADLDSLSKKDSPVADFKGYSVPVIHSGLRKMIGQCQKHTGKAKGKVEPLVAKK